MSLKNKSDVHKHLAASHEHWSLTDLAAKSGPDAASRLLAVQNAVDSSMHAAAAGMRVHEAPAYVQVSRAVTPPVSYVKSKRKNPRPMFLRSGELLAKRFGLPGKAVYDGWDSVESFTADQVDTKVRSLGWHFIRVTSGSVRAGVGLTLAAATEKAMRSGLDHLSDHFNAAELTSTVISRYPGFFVVYVTLASRQIQECASLGLVDEAVFRAPDRAEALLLSKPAAEQQPQAQPEA